MLEMMVDALKMYYTEILTHGIALLVGVGIGITIGGKVWNEEEIHKSSDSGKTGKEENE